VQEEQNVKKILCESVETGFGMSKSLSHLFNMRQ